MKLSVDVVALRLDVEPSRSGPVQDSELARVPRLVDFEHGNCVPQIGYGAPGDVASGSCLANDEHLVTVEGEQTGDRWLRNAEGQGQLPGAYGSVEEQRLGLRPEGRQLGGARYAEWITE